MKNQTTSFRFLQRLMKDLPFGILDQAQKILCVFCVKIIV